MQTNPAIEQSIIIRWSESLWNQSGRMGCEWDAGGMVNAEDVDTAVLHFNN